MSTPAEEASGLTLKQVAEELGVPLYRVRVAVEHLGDRISHQVAERGGGRGAPKRLYGPKAVAAIAAELGQKKKPYRNAAEFFASLGPWEGETPEELRELLGRPASRFQRKEEPDPQ